MSSDIETWISQRTRMLPWCEIFTFEQLALIEVFGQQPIPRIRLRQLGSGKRGRLRNPFIEKVGTRSMTELTRMNDYRHSAILNLYTWRFLNSAWFDIVIQSKSQVFNSIVWINPAIVSGYRTLNDVSNYAFDGGISRRDWRLQNSLENGRSKHGGADSVVLELRQFYLYTWRSLNSAWYSIS